MTNAPKLCLTALDFDVFVRGGEDGAVDEPAEGEGGRVPQEGDDAQLLPPGARPGAEVVDGGEDWAVSVGAAADLDDDVLVVAHLKVQRPAAALRGVPLRDDDEGDAA